MATTTHSGFVASAATALSTEFNSLANATATAASAAIDNTSTLTLFADFELVIATQGSARAAGAVVELYLTESLDGTNYDDVLRGVSRLIAVFPLDAAVTARRITVADVPIPPSLFKVFAYNNTGQAFAASASTIRYRTHNIVTA